MACLVRQYYIAKVGFPLGSTFRVRGRVPPAKPAVLTSAQEEMPVDRFAGFAGSTSTVRRSTHQIHLDRSAHVRVLSQSQPSAHNHMLKLPPPIWAIYVLTAAVISWFFGWSKVPGLPLAALGISLVATAPFTESH
jgi:hypothetical protein